MNFFGQNKKLKLNGLTNKTLKNINKEISYAY